MQRQLLAGDGRPQGLWEERPKTMSAYVGDAFDGRADFFRACLP
ncbi:hypothetical protein [Saccharothrix sp. ST-888]|nr:hypothetical protein [Saccharothrix sp. ST-888]